MPFLLENLKIKEVTVFQPLIDLPTLSSVDQKIINIDLPRVSIHSTGTQSKPLVMASYQPSSFGQMVYGMQKINQF